MIVVSPHFDDAVLSCWHLLDGDADALVVNVFSGAPPSGAPLGWWDGVTGATDAAARVRERLAEDRAALAVAGRPSIELGFLDGQHGRDPGDREAIESRLRELAADGSALAAPAGLDEHEDHCIVRDAAVALRREGVEVVLYADLPHASVHGWPDMVLDGDEAWQRPLCQVGVDTAGLSLEVHRLEPSDLRRKLSAVERYPTQLAALEHTFGTSALSDALSCEAVWRSAMAARRTDC